MFELGVPVLGICYGMQTMAQQLGGALLHRPSASSAMRRSRYPARAGCSMSLQDRASRDGQAVLDVWMSHGDRVDELPEGFSRHGVHGCDRRSRP